METKRCRNPGCKQNNPQPISEFSPYSKSRDKLKYICIHCNKDRCRAHYQKNKTEIKAKSKTYYNAHKDENKLYRETHKDEIKAYRDTHIEQRAEYLRTNSEHIREVANKKNRTEIRRFNAGKYESRSRGYEWHLTFEQWRSLVIGQVCHYCGGPLPEVGYAIDRKDNNLNYIYDNCVPCCKNCNRTKGRYLSYEEMLLIARIRKEAKGR
jgi:5-methylcytosine-specific restriction endonuclease McrA